MQQKLQETNLQEKSMYQKFKMMLSLHPLYEWDILMEQAIITLNLLRSARLNSKLSAYAFMFSEFDYNKTPIAPPWTKILAHTNSSNCITWGPHGDQW